MKSHQQLQQQAVTAAMVKKQGQHGSVGRRRLRRNVDVVVNAMKNRSQSSNQQHHSIVQQINQGQNTSHSRIYDTNGIQQVQQKHSSSQQQQQQSVNMQYFSRKQLPGAAGPVTAGSTHCHSHQVLDNSIAIQQKINMYTNQVSSKSQTKNIDQSPLKQVNSAKMVPPQFQRAYLRERANQIPNQATSQQQTQIYAQGPSNNNNNIQVQLQQMIGSRRVPAERNHQMQQQQTHIPGGNNLSSYQDAVPMQGTHSKIVHHSSAQNLEPLPRSQSQLTAGAKSGAFVQIKSSNKSNRNAAYGGTLTQRQKSIKKLNPSNTLYSQISLKDMNSPGKAFKVAPKMNIQKMTGATQHANQRATSQKYAPLQQPGTNSAHSFVQYGNNQQPQPALEAFNSDMKEQMHSLVDGVTPGESSQNKSRNYSNIISTNGVTHGSQGAILNISTANDINIYNNAFIVQTSPSIGQLKAIAANSQQQNKGSGTGNHKRQNHKNGSSNTGSQEAGGSQNRNRNASPFLPSQSQHQPGLQGQQRSKSTGRNLNKSSSQNQRVAAIGGMGNNPSKMVNREQAINDAYSSNQTYLINNQQVKAANQLQQQQQQPGQNFQVGLQQLTPNQLQQRFDQAQQMMPAQMVGQASQSIYNQAISAKKQALVANTKGYNSTEAIKRSEDSVIGGGSVQDQRNSSLTRPFYNNLVTSGDKRSSFGHANGMVSGTKRNFKSVKGSKETVNGKNFHDSSNSSNKKSHGNLFPKQQSISDRASELIRNARVKIKSKDYNEAIKLLSEVLDNIEPGNTEAIFYRALSYLDQGNLQQAISELWCVVEKRLTLGGKLLELCQQSYILLAIAHKRLGEAQNAIQDLELCIEIFPQYADAYLARGQHLLLQEQFTEALADFEKFIELNKTPFSGYLGVGDCFKAKKQYSEASKAYSKAIKLLPQQQSKPNYEQLYQQCYLKRGLSSYHEAKYSQALADLQLVIQRDTSNVKAHYYIGKLLAKGTENDLSQQTDAILHFEQVAKYQDQEFFYGNAMFQMAKLRLRQKAYFEAFHCLKRAADNNFASKRLAMYKDFTEGVLYLVKRKIKKGVQILSDLLEILVNKDKDKKKKNEKTDVEKQQSTIDYSQRKANKAHSDYLIHQILHFRAYGYVAIEKYELAQEDIRRVAKYGKVDAATTYNKWLGKGILRMDHEDYLMASKFFTKAWRKFPGNKDPYCLQVISIVRSYTYSLGGYNMDQQIKFDKVLETKKFMDKAITNCCKKTHEPSLYFFRGLLNFQMHNFLDALTDFNSAIECEEESSAQFYLARGRTYACLCVLTEAMKDLSVALNLDETLQQAYIYRGKCAYLIGDNNLAFLDFQRLILTDPKNPMVHIYAGNLLMTTGAYSDAIKAYENADTVEKTCISAFQRVRCYCALSDLNNAKKMMDETKKQQPNDVLLNFDSLCLDELIKVGQTTNKVSDQANLQPADKKNHEQMLKMAVMTFDELVATYMSDRLMQLKRRDSILNVQIIPNVQRVRIEKVLLAQDVAQKKELLSEEQKADLPTISVDLDEPVNMQQLKKTDSYSYYYENIFNLEDFYLYRGVFKFYQGLYREAVEDFESALQIYKSNRSELQGLSGNQKHAGAHAGATRNPSGFNSRNHTLQHYSIGHQGNGGTGEGTTLQSNATDLSDVGLSSFNELEIIYNIFLCHLLLCDRNNTLSKLNELQRKSQKRYAKQIPILRIIALEQFGETEKANAEIQRLQKQDNELFRAIFGANLRGKPNPPFLLELFPGEGRLCSFFAPQQLKLQGKPNGLIRGVKIQIRLSFSMPFVKPPNMIPNVDEEGIQVEFNLKQIDAPMPEAPWIKRCEHGIMFTEQLNKDGKDREKYLKFFSSKSNPANKNPNKNKARKSQGEATNSGAVIQTDFSMRTRLLNNMVAETLSDRNKISLMEDGSPRIVNDEDECLEIVCQNDRMADLNQSRESVEDDEEAVGHTEEDQNILNSSRQAESEESYDSEDIMQKAATNMMAIRESNNLIDVTGDSMVNMGENLKKDNIKELKKMKNEIVDPKIGKATKDIKLNELLPKFEKNKVDAQGNGRVRYAQFDESEELKEEEYVLSQSLLNSQNQSNIMLAASQKLEKARQSEPQRLNEQMLAGQHLNERRVSNLSISDLGISGEAANIRQGEAATKTGNKALAAQHQVLIGKNVAQKNKASKGAKNKKRSKFRTSIDDQSN